MPDQPKDQAVCPMGVDPISAIGVLIAKVDGNTELTQCIARKMDVHAESHKAIDQHMADVRRVLFQKDGLTDQARDCKNFRAGQDKRSLGWPVWVGAIGGVVAAVAVIAQCIVMVFHKY